MWSGFGASLSFEGGGLRGGWDDEMGVGVVVAVGHEEEEGEVAVGEKAPMRDGFREWVEAAALWESVNTSRNGNTPANADAGLGYDSWLVEKKVKVKASPWEDGGDVGDSCCFGTRTVEAGKECVWKLHDGV